MRKVLQVKHLQINYQVVKILKSHGSMIIISQGTFKNLKVTQLHQFGSLNAYLPLLFCQNIPQSIEGISVQSCLIPDGIFNLKSSFKFYYRESQLPFSKIFTSSQLVAS